MQDTTYNVEEIYSEVRQLHAQLQSVDKQEDAAAWRRAHIEADRYLMANKEVLLPILIDALSRQIRGLRSTEAALEFAEPVSHEAQIITLEDYLLNPTSWPPPYSTKPTFFQRMVAALRGGLEEPMVQCATDGKPIKADVNYSVKLKDGRYGVVQVKHSSGLMEIQGPDSLFTAVDNDLFVAIAPPKKVKSK